MKSLILVELSYRGRVFARATGRWPLPCGVYRAREFPGSLIHVSLAGQVINQAPELALEEVRAARNAARK